MRYYAILPLPLLLPVAAPAATLPAAAILPHITLAADIYAADAIDAAMPLLIDDAAFTPMPLDTITPPCFVTLLFFRQRSRLMLP